MNKNLIAKELLSVARIFVAKDDLEYASFNNFEIGMTLDQAESCSHPGQCDADVKRLLRDPEIKKQLRSIPADKIRKELKEYGAWNEEELKDEEENQMRILWIAAGNIVEEKR